MLRDFAIFKAMPKNLMLPLNAGIPGKLNEIKPGRSLKEAFQTAFYSRRQQEWVFLDSAPE